MVSLYKQLVSSEKQLRRCFITKTVLIFPTTNVSQYRLRSYRILIHAEIEYFIEKIILSKVEREKSKWDSTKIVNNCLANLFAYNEYHFPKTVSRLSEISSNNDFIFRMNKVLVFFKNTVKNNNGIKEENIIPLLVPLGIDYSKINQTLLNNMSSYGHDRGDVAHNSSKVQQLINPVDEINKVNQIISDLYDLVNLINKIK